MTRDAEQLRRDIAARLVMLDLTALEVLERAELDLAAACEARRCDERVVEQAIASAVCETCLEPVVRGECECDRMLAPVEESTPGDDLLWRST